MLTNIFVSVIVCMVIMIIGNSLARAFALVGALSIIRFRTVVKDTKDTAYIFWSLAVGMACGTGSYFLALAGNIIIIVIALLLYYSNFGSIIKSEFIVQFRINLKEKEISNQYNKILKEYTKSSTLLSSESSEDNDSLRVSYDILLKEEKNQNEIVAKLSKIKGLSEVVIIASKSNVDY